MVRGYDMNEFDKERAEAVKLCTDAEWKKLQDGFYNENAIECRDALIRIEKEESFNKFARDSDQRNEQINSEPSFLEVQRAAQAQSDKEDWARREAQCAQQSRIWTRQQQDSDNNAALYD